MTCIFIKIRNIVLPALALVLVAGVGLAASLDQPKADSILTVSGKISVTNAQATAQFDRAMLEKIGMVSFTTMTPWYKEPVKFEGVPLAKLMAALEAKGEKIVVVAMNDYSAEVPMEDIAKYNVILALKRDGEYMTSRDKGPLFIVYPYDSNPDLKNQKFYSRSVWQVAKIEVK